jgi:quercetin dioxygenase-like cupin family protein
MATIKFVRGDERKFVTLEERAQTDPRLAARLKELPSRSFEGLNFVHHEGSVETPELFEVRLPPGCKIEAHAHEADEIIVVTEGEVVFGKQIYGVGSSVFIPKMTLYSFHAGPAGLTFLNFRPVKNPGSLTKDEFMAQRKAPAQ